MASVDDLVPDRKNRNQTIFQKIKHKLPQILSSILAANGAFVFGTNIGWSSQSYRYLVQKKEYQFSVSKEQFSWISSVLALGALLGGLLGGPIVNGFGRKGTILLTFLPFLFGWFLIIFAVRVYMFYAGRVVLGVCCGIFTVAVPIYIGEISEKDIRGSLGGLFQLLIVLGIAFAYGIGSVANVMTTSIVLLTVPLVFLIPFFFMPETPTYLVSAGRTEKARASLRYLYGEDCDEEGYLDELVANVEENKHITTLSVWKELDKFVVLYALCISLGLQFFQQLSGINVIIFYSEDLFAKSSSSISSNLAAALVSIIQIIATALALSTVDRTGRKVLLIVSAIIMTICTSLLGVYFYLQKHDKDTFKGIPQSVPILLVSIYIAAFSFGLGPVPWILLGELFTPASKGLACGMSVSFNWLLTFIVTKTYVNIEDSMGIAATFWLFAGLTALGALFCAVIVVETKELTLKEILEKLENRKDRLRKIFCIRTS